MEECTREPKKIIHIYDPHCYHGVLKPSGCDRSPLSRRLANYAVNRINMAWDSWTIMQQAEEILNPPLYNEEVMLSAENEARLIALGERIQNQLRRENGD
jgi:hypothetical protein